MHHILVVAFVVGLELTAGPVGLLLGSGVLLAYLVLVTGLADALAAGTAPRRPHPMAADRAALHVDRPDAARARLQAPLLDGALGCR